MSKFQIISLFVFTAVILIAVLMFSGVLPGSGRDRTKIANLKMWGDIPKNNFQAFISLVNQENKESFKIAYSYKDPLNYENELLNALASGKGPDMWLISQDMILKNKDKVFMIPYESVSKRDFKDRFIEEGELFLSEDGIVGIPFVVDPLVLYWNRDMFSSVGIAQAPKFWDEFLVNAPLFVFRDDAGNIIESGAAFGEFRNVSHAKDIISMLILQTGNRVVDAETLEILLDDRSSLGLSPAENAIRFFIEFSNPAKQAYSWNRSLPDSSIAFTNGSLAMYFGYASEITEIQERNPHLNFDVASVPQIRGGAVGATFGRMRGIVISKSSRNVSGAFSVGFKMLDPKLLEKFSAAHFLMPTERAVLAKGSEDSILSVFYKSAIQSRAWLEPNPKEVSKIFQNMVESTATGKIRASQAVRSAKKQLEELFKEL